MSLFAGAATAVAAPPDPRCHAYDRAVTENMKTLLESDDARSTVQAYAAVSQLVSARFDCSQGKTDSALATYRNLQRMFDRSTPDVTSTAQ